MLRALVLALLSLPAIASANPQGIVAMAPIRLQIKSDATKAGFLNKGSGERLTVKTLAKAQMGQPGMVEASIRGIGGMTGTQKNTVLATAKFEITRTSEGQIAKPIKQGGQEWLRRMFVTAPQ